MSLLGQGSSSRNVLPDGDDFDWSRVDGLTDNFADDVDDDNLSLDGIYDEDEDEDDNQNDLKEIPPPIYEEPVSSSPFSKFLDIKNAPQAAAGSSAFAKPPLERPLPNILSRSQAATVNSPTYNYPFLSSKTSLPLPPDPPAALDAPTRTYYPGIDVCIVCQSKPPYSKNGKSYPTCGLTCARVLEYAMNGNKSPPGDTGYTPPPPPPPRQAHANAMPAYNTPQRQNPEFPVGPNIDLPSFLAGMSMASPSRPHRDQASSSGRRPYNRFPTGNSTSLPAVATGDPCVVCRRPLAANSKYVTCGLTCAEKLSTGRGGNSTMCNYCHRRPKLASHNQCGQNCAQAAKVACLLCKSRPKFKRYHLCGKTCKQLSTKKTPLLLEVPMEHATWEMVQKKFDSAWKIGTKPTIKKIYKIIEGRNFLLPYDRYKKTIGKNTEVFRYHGTSRRCKLGTNGNTMLCNDSGCSLCCILKTSFKTSLANPHGAFGAGIYSSSAANKAYSYSSNGQGALVLTKVILGKVHNVNAFGAVSSCPAGHNSVVFDRQNGALNETIVYSDDAIRPVFLLVFT